MSYDGKYKAYVHPVSNGRYIVAEKRGKWWFTFVTKENPGTTEVQGYNTLDLVAAGARTYANVNAAIKAFRRWYNWDDDAREARPKEAEVEGGGRQAVPGAPVHERGTAG